MWLTATGETSLGMARMRSSTPMVGAWMHLPMQAPRNPFTRIRTARFHVEHPRGDVDDRNANETADDTRDADTTRQRCSFPSRSGRRRTADSAAATPVRRRIPISPDGSTSALPRCCGPMLTARGRCLQHAAVMTLAAPPGAPSAEFLLDTRIVADGRHRTRRAPTRAPGPHRRRTLRCGQAGPRLRHPAARLGNGCGRARCGL